jgi:hypothetical protein
VKLEKRLLSMVVAGCVLQGVSPCAAWSAERPGSAEPSATSAVATAANWRSRDSLYYKRNWGVEIIGIKPVSSGYMLAFRYRVLDPEKAKVLNDRHSRAYLRDEATGTVLAVPAMENIGELRTGSAPEADRTYFMIFGNPGKLVKTGSRVTVVAGNLHVDGLIVD